MRFRLLALVLATLIVCTTGSFAQSFDQQLRWCNALDGASPDQIISGCTAVIQSNKVNTLNLALVLNRRGNIYNGKGQYDLALQDFDHSIRLNPRDGGVFYNRGNSYNMKGSYDRAIQAYEQAIRLNPNFVDAFVARGVAYYGKGQYDRAIQDYDQAIRLQPNNALAFQNRSTAKIKKNDVAGANADIARAKQLNPNIK